MAAISVSINQYKTALDHYRATGMSAEDLQALEWLWAYAHQELGNDLERTAELVETSTTTIFRILGGKYEGSVANVIDKIKGARKRVQDRPSGLIETPVVTKIWETLDYCRDMRTMVVVRGDTGRGKTYAVQEWQRNNNHGASIYVRASSAGTVGSVLRSIGKAMGVNRKSSNTTDLAEVIARNFSERCRTLVLDEAGLLFPRGRGASGRVLDTLRDFHDMTGCGIALIVTNVYWDRLKNGPHADFFAQFLGRTTFGYRIPDAPTQGEVLAFLQHYVPEPAHDLIEEGMRIAGSGGHLRDLCEDLVNAKRFAALKGKPFDGKILKQAHAWRTAHI